MNQERALGLQGKSVTDLIEERFETYSGNLPVFNAVALELLQLKEKGSASGNEIADLIMRDQVLAGRMLQEANSSFYGGLKQVDTIKAAVMRLGIVRVASLAMVAAQVNAHAAGSKRIGAMMPGLWQRSFASAVGARWLAKQLGYDSRAEEAFLAGLLHDIGELFLLRALDQIEVDKNDQPTITDVLVQEIIHSLHAPIGCRLMLRWKLPTIYAEIARDHDADEFDESNMVLAIVRLLDVACRKLGIGQNPDPDIALAATAEARVLGVKLIKLAQLEVLLEDTIDNTPGLS